MTNSEIFKQKSSLTKKMLKAMKNKNIELAKSCVLSIEALDARLSYNVDFLQDTSY